MNRTFIEFISKNGNNYFVGSSAADILADTNGGTKFGGFSFSSHREITEEEVRLLNFECLDVGIKAVQDGCKSYMIGIVRPKR